MSGLLSGFEFRRIIFLIDRREGLRGSVSFEDASDRYLGRLTSSPLILPRVYLIKNSEAASGYSFSQTKPETSKEGCLKRSIIYDVLTIKGSILTTILTSHREHNDRRGNKDGEDSGNISITATRNDSVIRLARVTTRRPLAKVINLLSVVEQGDDRGGQEIIGTSFTSASLRVGEEGEPDITTAAYKGSPAVSIVVAIVIVQSFHGQNCGFNLRDITIVNQQRKIEEFVYQSPSEVSIPTFRCSPEFYWPPSAKEILETHPSGIYEYLPKPNTSVSNSTKGGDNDNKSVFRNESVIRGSLAPLTIDTREEAIRGSGIMTIDEPEACAAIIGDLRLDSPQDSISTRNVSGLDNRRRNSDSIVNSQVDSL
ncbi:hypothetical protein G7Y89_g7279 [Cudoniella acicularis]|uniref:Uncharacterized protein n=1 Tax=Cudoniella acicularis TaxID=354080 RepID=A0A8H4RKS5_9HELO|nr:hypothetical protein G7Y89_g7279 [Cudoniella acicularis]